MLEHLPRWATEDAGKGQRLPRLTKAGRWLLQWSAADPGGVLRLAVSGYDLKWAEFPDTDETPVLKYIKGPELTRYINEFTTWFVGNVDTFTIWFKDFITEWLINPFQDLLGLSPWWSWPSSCCPSRTCSAAWKPAVTTYALRGRYPWMRPVERHDDHADDDARRHR